MRQNQYIQVTVASFWDDHPSFGDDWQPLFGPEVVDFEGFLCSPLGYHRRVVLNSMNEDLFVRMHQPLRPKVSTTVNWSNDLSFCFFVVVPLEKPPEVYQRLRSIKEKCRNYKMLSQIVCNRFGLFQKYLVLWDLSQLWFSICIDRVHVSIDTNGIYQQVGGLKTFQKYVPATGIDIFSQTGLF